uniref:Uncharacterized protein n=1 Tax=Arundo donax TaxID=35708 RepID=A0A0A9H508_ARUDO
MLFAESSWLWIVTCRCIMLALELKCRKISQLHMFRFRLGYT